MLTYTMSDDGNRAQIGPCVGGFVRLSIIRICKGQGWPVPPKTLEESTGLEELKDINTALQYRRSALRQEQRKAKAEQLRADQQAREQRLPAHLRAKVAELRRRASNMREGALYADRNEDMNREMREADRLDEEAAYIINDHSRLTA